jgi:hypothetical protein
MGFILCLLAIVGLLGLIKAQSLPYNPSTIFLSSRNTNTAYVFLPAMSTSPQNQLASIDISSRLQSSNLSLTVLTASLPFLQGDNAGSIAYTACLSESGTIGVYAGSCASNSSFWIFNPANTSIGEDTDGGTWIEIPITRSPMISNVALPNANFLASAFSFSVLAESNDTQRTVYTFGGMCPTGAGSNTSIWQNAASYSNNMLKLSPSPSSYQLSLASSDGIQPIAEAGFTITGLTPTFSNSSSGIVTQAQNFILLGGHTKAAFINMSQVALFSLPQEGWSFHTINSASSTGSTELTMRSSASTAVQAPDSRSGHTAILSSDGTALIVFGGWVGDINTAADPQLAILHLGSGFGGTGDWAWEIPSTSGAALSSGEGIYGHGAIMLPGNVMMVVGGYSIVSPGSSESKRSRSGTQALFLNMTSMSWISDYTNPSYTARPSTSLGDSSSDSSNSRKIGLGAGLGLGLAAVIGVVIFYCWYSRKLKRREELRECDLRALGQSAHEYYMNNSMTQRNRDTWFDRVEGGEMAYGEDMIPRPSATSSLGSSLISGSGKNTRYTPAAHFPADSYGGNGDSAGQSPIPNAGSSRGLPLIPRKPISTWNARGNYQPTPNTLAHPNGLGTAGVIHPIYEADEDIEISGDHNAAPDSKQDSDVVPTPCEPSQDVEALGLLQTRNPRPISDPFTDPPAPGQYTSLAQGSASRPGTGYEQYIGRSTPSPVGSARAREREIKEWVADWAAAGTLLSPQSCSQSLINSGRVSPTKESISGSGRTESNLSERSIATARSLGLSRNSSVRNNSLTAFFAGSGGSWNPFAPSGSTAVGLGSITEQSHGTVSPRSEQLGSNGHGLQPPPSSGSGTSSFNTAHTTQSGPMPRVEAERLLPQSPEYTPEGSPSKIKAMKLGRSQEGWLGSLKRVFAAKDEDHPGSFVSSSAQSSPTREYNYGSNAPSGSAADFEPRRPGSAASVTATMWRRKQGRGDWEDSAEPIRRSNTLTTDGSGRPLSYDLHGLSETENADDEDDWDIERAVERRVVQVMFTVPKEKLRVVNHDVDMDEKSEAGSLHGGDTSGESMKGKSKGKVKARVEEIEKGK